MALKTLRNSTVRYLISRRLSNEDLAQVTATDYNSDPDSMLTACFYAQNELVAIRVDATPLSSFQDSQEL